jgi:hypothetical protein
MLSINEKLQDNINASLPDIKIEKINFNIKLITKNDIICILSSYQFLKKFIYKHMHVIDKEYYTPTKDDVIEFRNELYNIYTLLCEYFNKNKNNYVEDIHKKFGDVLELVKDLEKYKDIPVNAVVDANAVVEANAVEATDTAIGAEDYGEGDEGIAKEKIDTNDKDTGDKGLKEAKQKELETEEQDNKNKSVIAKNIEKKEPVLTPAQALGLEDTNTKKEDENEADFRKLEESMNNTQNERATTNPLGAAQGMLEGAVQQQTKQLTALTDAANDGKEQLTALTDTAKGKIASIFDSFGSLKAQATTPAGLLALASGQAQQPQQGERGQLQIPTYTRGLAGSVAKSK